jgi:HTH-type transcriptional regulator/antitoxin HigA
METAFMTLVTESILTRRYRDLQRAFPLRSIKTKKEAEQATAILDARFNDSYDDPGEEAYILALADLLYIYEEKRDPFKSTATGSDVLKHLVEENGIKQSELSRLLDVGQSAVSQILNGAKPITAEHARRLGKRFNLNPGVFL